MTLASFTTCSYLLQQLLSVCKAKTIYGASLSIITSWVPNSLQKSTTIHDVTASATVGSKMYLLEEHFEANTRPSWSLAKIPTLISYLVASTAASQLNLSFPTGGFFHIPLGITRIGGLGLCLLTAVWYSSIALRALHTSWEGLVKFPPKTTSFLRSQILCATVATTYISPSSILSIRVPICCGLLVWWESAPLKHHYDRSNLIYHVNILQI